MTKKQAKNPVDYVAGKLKKSAWASVLESAAVLVFGVLLVAWPDMMLRVVSVVLGVVLIVAGLYQIADYFAVKGQNDFFNNSLVFGVISVLLGIVGLCFVDETFYLFRIIIGVWLVFGALMRINMAIKLHAAQVSTWGWVLLVGVVMLVVGLFTLFNGGLITRVVGAMMIVSGVVGIFGDAMFMGKVDELGKKLKG